MARSDLRNKHDLLLTEGGVIIPIDKDPQRSVTLIMKVGTTQTTGLHWHETKTEYLQILQGQAKVTVGDKTAVFGPEDGVIVIPKYTVHEFGRADKSPEGGASLNIDLRIKESTDPPDGAKEIFFRNMLGILIDRKEGILGNIKTLLALFVVMQDNDNFPVFTRGPAILGERAQNLIRRGTTYLVRGGIALIGKTFGFKGIYEEYTPSSLLNDVKNV